MKQRFCELANLLLDNIDSGYRFWLRYKDKYLTGEGVLDNNLGSYAVIYLTDEVDNNGYPGGNVIKAVYIDNSTRHKVEAIYDYLTTGECEPTKTGAKK